MSKKDYGFLKGRNMEMKDFQIDICRELSRLNQKMIDMEKKLITKLNIIDGQLQLK